jgi:Tol biopolymer transport system component
MKQATTLILALTATACFQVQTPREQGLALTLVDLEGNRDVIGIVPETVFAPRISPDGRQVALDTPADGVDGAPPTGSVWIADIDDVDDRYALPNANGTLNYAPAWTPDGERVLFLASTREGDTLYWQSADGSGDAEHLIDARAPESWLPDGPTLTFLTLTGIRDYGISALDLSTGETRQLVDLPGSEEHSSNVSKDGRFIVYVSNASGTYELFVAPLPFSGTATRLETNGGAHPIWSPDGRSIYFDRDGTMYRIGFDPSSGEVMGSEEALPITGFIQGPLRRQFDLTPDGTRFLMLFPQD